MKELAQKVEQLNKKRAPHPKKQIINKKKQRGKTSNYIKTIS